MKRFLSNPKLPIALMLVGLAITVSGISGVASYVSSSVAAKGDCQPAVVEFHHAPNPKLHPTLIAVKEAI